MTAFSHGTENTKKLFTQGLKLEKKMSGTLFLDFILSFNIAVEKFCKK